VSPDGKVYFSREQSRAVSRTHSKITGIMMAMEAD
jgi:hypothetical protein